MSKPLRVLSLGAGVQSSTLALMAAHGEIEMPDCAIFADVQSEPASVYHWLDWLEKQLPFPVLRISAGVLADRALEIRVSKSGTLYQKSSPPAFIIDDLSAVGLLKRQCTSDFKITPIIRKLRELGGKKSGVVQLIGISWDERHRMKPARDPWIKNIFPLIDQRITRTQCKEWMATKGYPEPPRSSCYFCPYHSPDEWIRLQNEEPEYFEKAINWEKLFQGTMRHVSGFRGTPYLNRECKPLDKIDFVSQLITYQTDLFGNECEGMCGV